MTSEKSLEETFLPKLDLIIESADVALTKVNGYLTTTRLRPDISKELLTILNLSDDLVELFNPTKQSGEYFGLPKEMVLGAKTPKTISTTDGIDFTSWFAEKTTKIKTSVKDAITYWEFNPDTLQLREGAPMTSDEYIIDGLESGLARAMAYAETVRDMIQNN